MGVRVTQHHSFTHQLPLSLAAVLLAATLMACSGTAASAPGGAPAANKGALNLRLGYLPNITHATAIVGIENGSFATALAPNAGLQTSTFSAGPAAVEALFSNAIDASYMGPNPAVNAYVRSHGDAVRIIAGATSGGASLVVRPEISTAADLRGKKIASPQLGNTQDVALRSWLQRQGLKTDTQGGGDASITPQENADTLTSFKAGQIAAAWVPEPWATRLVLEGGGKVLVDERSLWPGGQFTTTLLVVRTDFLQKHPAAVEGLLRGHVKATDFVNQHPEDAQRIVNDALTRVSGKPLSQQVISGAWATMSFTNDPLASTLTTSANAAAALGFLKLDGVDLKRIYDLRLLNTILKGNGSPEVQGS